MIHCGDCLEVMKTMDAESVDAVVTDPPYGLSAGPASYIGDPNAKGGGFMGKSWDPGVPGPEFWAEALRVARPGAHLVAFGGTRTFHRLACAIEDAGWELRDTVGYAHRSGDAGDCPWLLAYSFGSGFPKSLDVSKAIDKAAGAKREVLGTVRKTPSAGGAETNDGWTRPWAEGKTTMDLTAPATDDARRWQGWGTAIKPAFEPIVLARKPLGGRTVAANVLEHGTGGLNIDACRISALTGQRPGDTLTAWEPEKNLCDSCARPAASPAKPGTPATRGTSAGSLAAPTTSGKGEKDRTDTGMADTGCSAGLCPGGQETGQTADSSSSTGVSGKMPTGRSRRATKSTTSTATGSTTGLRTCNACGCSITDPGTSGNTPASKNGTPNTHAAQGSAALGRWPSNLCHDGSDEVLAMFPETKSGSGDVSGIKREDGDGWGMGGGSRLIGDSGSAARFFFRASNSLEELLFCRAKAIMAAWNNDLANTADDSSILSSELVASVVSDAATLALRGATPSRVSTEPSTGATPSESRRLCEAAITAILSSENEHWRGRSLDVCIPNGCRASSAEACEPTATMTITTSLPRSDGSVASATFSIMPPNSGRGVAGSASRIHYTAKASRSDREEGLEGFDEKQANVTGWTGEGMPLRQDGTERREVSRANHHPTVKPTALMRWLCRLVTPPGGLILDPFTGSGSTGKAAILEGFRFVGIEKDPEYVKIARARIAHAERATDTAPDMFAPEPVAPQNQKYSQSSAQTDLFA